MCLAPTGRPFPHPFYVTPWPISAKCHFVFCSNFCSNFNSPLLPILLLGILYDSSFVRGNGILICSASFHILRRIAREKLHLTNQNDWVAALFASCCIQSPWIRTFEGVSGKTRVSLAVINPWRTSPSLECVNICNSGNINLWLLMSSTPWAFWSLGLILDCKVLDGSLAPNLFLTQMQNIVETDGDCVIYINNSHPEMKIVSIQFQNIVCVLSLISKW